MAVETLRPNAIGDEESIPLVVGNGVGSHWAVVDEADPDDGTTRVQCNVTSYLRDLYNLPASSGAGVINFIKIYVRCILSDVAGATGNAKPSLKSNSTVTDGTEIDLTRTWTTYSEQWNTNPADSQAWEWADIDALQIGVSLKRGTRDAHCTQVYVVIDYTSTVVVTPSTLALSLTAYAPTVSTPRLVTPPTLTLVIVAYAPTVLTPVVTTPPTLTLTLVFFTSTIIVSLRRNIRAFTTKRDLTTPTAFRTLKDYTDFRSISNGNL